MSLFDHNGADGAAPRAQTLPLPARSRWQPLRIGLVELFHYEEEEFWFHDGHLLLRGNNGTGKSKVLSLTLPFLLDASLSPSRVEPDGDRMKRMEWNLLMGRYDRRVGYTWVEFGRIGDDGVADFATLGCGLQAVSGRGRVEPWYFISEQRVGESLRLITAERTVVSRERLQELLGGHGRVFLTAEDYRRAVDERLFRLGDRYGALMDTLIQLRQPQLSKKPDEQSLSEALGNALPELSRAVLDDVAEAMNQLDEYRDELAQIEQLRSTVSQFGRRYRIYAQIQARRQARHVRKAQTDFDNQSRSLHDTRARLTQAHDAVFAHAAQCAEHEADLRKLRAELDELRSDPAMRDARRLDELTRATEVAERELRSAAQRLASAREQCRGEESDTSRRVGEHSDACARAAAEVAALRAHACDGGLLKEHERMATSVEADADDPRSFEDGAQGMLAAAARRDLQVAQVRRLLSASDEAERARDVRESRCGDRRFVLEGAETEARAAHQAFLESGSQLQQAWRTYLSELRLLSVPEPEAALAELADWVEAPELAAPIHSRVDAALRQFEGQCASTESELVRRGAELAAEDAELGAEEAALRAGRQLSPAAWHTRDVHARSERAGAPLWQCLEFREHVSDRERAGLEAGLDAAGLLDAWVTPDGVLLHPDTRDAWLTTGLRHASSLLGWLQPHEGSGVAAEVVSALLGSIACGESDQPDADTWISPTGRFRLGRLSGAFQKARAEYVGSVAREDTRQARLSQIVSRRAELEALRLSVAIEVEQLRQRKLRAGLERQAAPRDDALRTLQFRFDALERQRREAQVRLAEAEVELERLERAFREARHVLVTDARDLRLPLDAPALLAVERALSALRAGVHALRHAVEQRARAFAELGRQRDRAERVRVNVVEAEQTVSLRERERDDVRARLAVLRETALAAVTELQRRLTQTQAAIEGRDQGLDVERRALSTAVQERARCEQRLEDEQAALEERTLARRLAAERLGGFGETGLLALALPDLEQAQSAALGIDAMLQLARRIEQSLSQLSAEDQDWIRIQNEISRDYTTLGQALSALGQKAQMEQSDFGLIVQVIYRSRPERPDVLEGVLGGEVEQRRGILSAREREILENHLQAEVAVHLQRLLVDAEARVERINDELKRRPTSTGVYFRLDWEPLPEGAEGAPVGLAAARARLLRRSADAWSPEDRRLVGEFLSARIDSERAQDEAGPLAYHLARALDYRRWHRFRVKRWHDGAFRPLSGPASSGERALGLTVPLFAAASSHYASAGTPHAPRLVLLDEAFAGIDDEARAHCMALIREFDLDFVMTSEREWGCYATLPGVAICQVVRREGIDAVFVSRWTWDGRVRRTEAAPGAAAKHEVRGP